MNVLERALIEKAGYENGFENNDRAEDSGVCLSSARHAARVTIGGYRDGKQLSAGITANNTESLSAELARSFPDIPYGNNGFLIPDIAALAVFLGRASALAQSLPNQLAMDYAKQVAEELAGISEDKVQATEIERIVRQRIGQQKFRQAMLEYWGGACAVTRISITAVLRASHAKPWAECNSDQERLDVFNGFLLCANLDALFDRFLISFEDTGQILISPKLDQKQRESLGLNKDLCLRWIAGRHCFYLKHHRLKFLESQKT